MKDQKTGNTPLKNWPPIFHPAITSISRAAGTCPLFRVHALTFIVERGSPEELAIFRDILEKREEAKYRLIAYKAVNKWGDEAFKHRVFIDSLREKDENLVQGGVMVFTGVRSDAVRTELCRIVKKGKFQMTRMAAALRLKEYTSTDIIPPLVMMLRENYIQRERGGTDIFATIITFGIASVFDDISRTASAPPSTATSRKSPGT